MFKGLGDMGDLSKMMEAAQQMQTRMAELQEGLTRLTVTGEAGAGLVKDTATAKGELTAALTLTVAGASKAAVEAIEKAGGKITLTRPAKEDAAETASAE